MKNIITIVFFVLLAVVFIISTTSVCDYVTESTEEACYIQQLIVSLEISVDRQIELEIIVAEQSDTIKLQATQIAKWDEAYDEMLETAIQLKAETYVLGQTMQQMLAYIKQLEAALKQEHSEDRNA